MTNLMLVVDETAICRSAGTAVLIFQLINARRERASTVLTSNKGFQEWGAVLGDEVMAAALIDRLLHHCHIVNIRGNSYRMKHHQELRRSMQRSVGRRRPGNRVLTVPTMASGPAGTNRTGEPALTRPRPKCAIFSCQNVQFSIAIDTPSRVPDDAHGR